MKWLTDMNNTALFASVIVLPMLVVSCFNGGRPKDFAEVKQEYTPVVNEVDVITIKEENFPLQLLSNGKLSASKRSALCFRQSGIVAKVYVSNGSRVSAGQVIAELENSDQQAAISAATLELERTALDLQDALIGLGYPLDKQDSIPKEVMNTASIRSGYRAAKNNLAQAKRMLEGTILRAPFSGRVANIKVKQWEPSGSEPFCTVLSDNEFDVSFTILESEHDFIAQGQRVSVSTFSGGAPVSGRIVSVNPAVDKNGQIDVTARIRAADGMLDGMNVKVTVDKMISSQLVVPKSAVVMRDGLEVLFRFDGENKAEWVYVNTLFANSTSYAVRANADRGATLKAGDMIIINGNLNLADGSHVKLKEQR